MQETPQASRDPALWVAMWLLVNVFIVGAYDVVATFRAPMVNTVSSYVQEWSSRWPLLAFGAGMIAGHLWFK